MNGYSEHCIQCERVVVNKIHKAFRDPVLNAECQTSVDVKIGVDPALDTLQSELCAMVNSFGEGEAISDSKDGRGLVRDTLPFEMEVDRYIIMDRVREWN